MLFLRHCPEIDYFIGTQDGFTVILVERGPGVETKPIKTSYSPTAGTAYITFDDVRVPVGNTLGEEGGGIFVMLRSVACALQSCARLSAFPIAISIMNVG